MKDSKTNLIFLTADKASSEGIQVMAINSKLQVDQLL